MRALVTGAAGFVGRHLVARLHREGFQVRAVMKTPSDRGNWDTGVETHIANLLDRHALSRAVQSVDVVFHCAAALPNAGVTPKEIDDVNIEGTRNLVDACVTSGRPRFVFVSTDSVYGDANHEGADESTAINPDYYTEGNYPRSKAVAEDLVMAACPDNGMPVSIVRPCLMYGPGRSAGNDILRRWASKRFHLLVDGGVARLSLLFVEDAADAIALAGTHPAAIGQRYNLSDGSSYSRREILDALAAAVGRRKRYVVVPSSAATAACRVLGIDPRRIAFAANSHVIDSSKIQRELGFKPRTHLGSGIQQTMPWLLDAQHRDLSDHEFAC